MEGENGVVVKAVQDLLALRESLDQQLAQCLERLQGACPHEQPSAEVEQASGIGTPSVELPYKRSRELLETSDNSVALSTQLTNDLPCRLDLSHWAQLFLQECVSYHVEVESRVGKRHRPTYLHGNYPHYYSYRLSDNSTMDPRIHSFQREWFKGKDCLDVGSHIGVLPLGIVTTFLPQSMTGVEIDASLCHQAKEMRCEWIRKYQKEGRLDVVSSLKKTHFIQEDFLRVAGWEGNFDVVTCLSVAKWIHFHHGDDGMRNLFHRFWDVLRSGSLLIFEPQSLRSYSKAFHKQDMSAVPYPLLKLQFFPDEFVTYLTEKVGFETVGKLTLDAISKGFERPIYLLRKP